MKKLSSLLVLCALVLGACGGGNEVAATVDGTDMTVSEVEGFFNKADDGAITKEEFAQLLSFNIILDIFSRNAESDFDITFTDEEIEAEASDIITSQLTEGQTREDFLTANEVTEQLLLGVAHQTLIQRAILEQMQGEVTEPTQEEIDAYFIEQAALMVCGSHILVATEAEAQDVSDRLAAGEDFADVAAEVSIDGSADSGGDLGCADPSQYVPEFAAAIQSAEVGVPTAPVETEFGFHVILVREDELPTNEQAIASLKDQAAQLAAQTWFLDTAAAADVKVNEKFGTWQAEPTPEVIPPADATTSTTTN